MRKRVAARDEQITQRNRADLNRIMEAKRAGLPRELKVWISVVENIDPMTNEEIDLMLEVLNDAKLLLEKYAEWHEGEPDVAAGAAWAEAAKRSKDSHPWQDNKE